MYKVGTDGIRRIGRIAVKGEIILRPVIPGKTSAMGADPQIAVTVLINIRAFIFNQGLDFFWRKGKVLSASIPGIDPDDPVLLSLQPNHSKAVFKQGNSLHAVLIYLNQPPAAGMVNISSVSAGANNQDI